MKYKKLLSRHNDKFLNISLSEWIRVLPAFIIKLLIQVSVIAGGTIITALFIEEYGADKLPIFFMIQALLVIFGTTIASGFLKKHQPSNLIIWGSFLASLCFISASFIKDQPIFYFSILFIGFSIFLTQVSIWMLLFIENLFSPLEGERTIPVIESAEPIGGIVSGLVIISFVSEISALRMILIVGVILAIVPSFLLVSIQKLNSIPVLKVRRKHRLQKQIKRNMFQNSIRFFRKNRFVTGLFISIFLTFFIVQILEYQYTLAVDEKVQIEAAHSYGPHTEHAIANALTHNFGEIQIGIFGILFFIQILFASRLLQMLGVMKTFALGPLLSLISFSAMFFHPSFITTILAKGTFEVTHGIGKNAFANIFYALHEDIRDDAKEVLEGIGKPLGLFFGTVAILLMELFLPHEKLSIWITITLCITTAFLFFLILRLQKKYTLVSKRKLCSQGNLPEKMNAIEILSQKGHIGSTEYLIEALHKKNELPEVQIKILKVMGILEDQMAIPAILKSFHSPQQSIRLAAVRALGNYQHLGKKFFSQAFSVYSMQSALKEIFLDNRDMDIKIAAIKVFANLKDPSIIPFLIKILKTKDPELMAESVSVCGMFKDVGTISYLEKHLNDPSPQVRAATIIALWQFRRLRVKLLGKMVDMLDSKNEEDLLAGIHTVGETKSVQERERLIDFLSNKNERVRRYAAIALAKMNENKAIEHLVEFLFHEEKIVGLKTKKMMRGVHKKIQNKIKKRSIQEAIARVSKILKKSKTSILEDLKPKDLHEIFHLFHLIDAEREMWKIRMILKEKGERLPVYS